MSTEQTPRCPCCGGDTTLTELEVEALKLVLGRSLVNLRQWVSGDFKVNRADFLDHMRLWPAARALLARGLLRPYRFSRYQEEMEATPAGAAALGLPTWSPRLQPLKEKSARMLRKKMDAPKEKSSF